MASTSPLVSAELRRELDRTPLRAIVEYVGRDRLGLHAGERQMTFVLSNGALRRSHVDAGPIRNEELEYLRFV